MFLFPFVSRVPRMCRMVQFHGDFSCDGRPRRTPHIMDTSQSNPRWIDGSPAIWLDNPHLSSISDIHIV